MHSGTTDMDEQELEAALSLLIDELEGDQGDRHEIYMRLRTIFQSMRAMGIPLPDDLLRLEEKLVAEFEKDINARDLL
jgi:hypothetical protein